MLTHAIASGSEMNAIDNRKGSDSACECRETAIYVVHFHIVSEPGSLLQIPHSNQSFESVSAQTKARLHRLQIDSSSDHG